MRIVVTTPTGNVGSRVLQLLVQAGARPVVPVRHLRCGYFFTNLLMQLDDLRAGTLPTPWPLDLPMAWVDPRDIGDVAAAALLAGPAAGRRVRAGFVAEVPRDATSTTPTTLAAWAAQHLRGIR